jgi:hypothetical protein
VPISDVVNQGTVTGCAVAKCRVTYRRIEPLCHVSQVVDRRFAGDLDMTLQAISLHQEGDNTSSIILFMTVQTSIHGIIGAVLVSIEIGGNCFANTHLSAGLSQTGIGAVVVIDTGKWRVFIRADSCITVRIGETGITIYRALPLWERLAIEHMVTVSIGSRTNNAGVIMTHSAVRL